MIIILVMTVISCNSYNSTPLTITVEAYLLTNKPSHINFIQEEFAFWDMVAIVESYKEGNQKFEQKNLDYIESLKNISHMCDWFALEYFYETSEEGYINVIHLVASDSTADFIASFNKHVSSDLVVDYYEVYAASDELEFLDTSEKILMNNISEYGAFMRYIENTDPYAFKQIIENN